MEGRAARVRVTTAILTTLLGFLLGSVPFGLLLTKAAGLGDIRNIGSGNIGATNVLRTGRRDLAAATLLLDGAKGAAAVLLARHFGGPGAVAGLAAVLGHTLTPWLGFRGGKGVATGLSALLGIGWPLGLAACAAWLVGAAVFRMSSAAALFAFAVSPFIALYLQPYPWPVPVIALWIMWRHRTNIARLRAGTEPRIGAK
jgi:glycerol-3-phosphate acyltransferase PlsY